MTNDYLEDFYYKNKYEHEIMRIDIHTIPHSEQRYPTVGDYFTDKEGTLHILVSKMSDPRYEQLVAIHELIEVLLTEHKNIKEEDITNFDLLFEAERAEGKHTDDEEPGWDPRSPYGRQHAFAEAIERLTALQLDVDWEIYDKEVNNL